MYCRPISEHCYKCEDDLCPPNQKCFSSTTQCECENGFVPNAVGDCRDIDECATDTHSCSDSSTCVNKEGSFECSDTKSKSFIASNSTSTTSLVTTSVKPSTRSTTTELTSASTTTTRISTSTEQVGSTVLVVIGDTDEKRIGNVVKLKNTKQA